MVTQNDIKRYRQNFLAEQESAALYRRFAEIESSPPLADLYRRLAEVEQRHATLWADNLRRENQPVPSYTPGWRVRLLCWIARRFGVQTVLPTITAGERSAHASYENQPEVRGTIMPAEERSHARLARLVASGIPATEMGSLLSMFEGRHRATGGNALRAAVLGASDGLTTNLSLVMGVAGANLPGHTILFTGLAGMLAGALSMAIGEWLSVQSAHELYTSQVAIEREEVTSRPEEEQEELALIYQAKGIDEQTAKTMAERIMSRKETALDTLAREELGINPEEMGGSAWEAAITSFLLFSVGAVLPVLPFAFGSGLFVTGISFFIGVLGLFIIGFGITLTTGVPLIKAGGRQVLLGVAAAAITFALGLLVGGRLG
ncbi:MAG: VIT1/CCC1 transporter family protein [Ktedonobacteraceae bacterium]|nr:VIT1/CCC1 transporter family protein [Ktedonobacteraceae bacterium]